MTASPSPNACGPASAPALQADRDAAMRLGIRSIPTLIVGADLARLQTTPLAALRQRLQRWPRPRPEPDPPASEPPGSFLSSLSAHATITCTGTS